MNAIDKTLFRLKKEKRVGLMTHVIVGYPNLEKTVQIVKVMAKAGADMIELQIPFSDPIADGPTIMKACERALKQGVKVRDAFLVATMLSKKVSAPLLFMAYYNTVFKYGVEKFCFDASRSGISGIIVPDMPLEEEGRECLTKFAKANGLHFIRVISPASTSRRLIKNAKVAEGFVYCSSRQGITGARKELSPTLVSYLKNVRKFFKIPVAVGFGISRAEHVKAVSTQADIAVVGSAVIDVINCSGSKSLLKNVGIFVRTLKNGSHRAM